MAQNLVHGPCVALGEIVHFVPCDRFFDFLFLSYVRFCKKKMADVPKNIPSPHCGGTVYQ